MLTHPLCPITQEPVVDPVVAPDGHTYERTAIVEWIQRNGTSPQTRQPMRVEDLVPNRALRDLINSEQKKRDTDQDMEEIDAAEPPPPADAHAQLSASVNATARKSSVAEHTIVNIEVPDAPECSVPNHICCVIDVSGSMQLEAPCKDETGQETSTGLSILDVVKFAALVISRSLGPNDRLSLVTFSERAETVLPPTRMDDCGKKVARDALSAMHVQGMTNLWAGVKQGVELASEVGSNFNNSVFVLTDGMPNVDPPLGYDRSLGRLLSKHPLSGSLSTFGFGYSLDSSLLNKLSRLGGGYYSFIPDAGFVGTCFINAVANARCAFGLGPKIVIHKLLEKDALKNLTADSQLIVEAERGSDPSRAYIYLTPLRYGQSVDIVLDRKYVSPTDMIELKFTPISGQEVSLFVQEQTGGSLESQDQFHFSRTLFVKQVRALLAAGAAPRPGFVLVKPPTESGDPALGALAQDVSGQATEAVSKSDWYDRWGRHYLHSLSGAHLHQFCNNFKDPGVQLYGAGLLFRALQEELNDIFEAIPPPKPSSPVACRPRSAGGQPRVRTRLTNMSGTFNNRRVVCVHGDTAVTALTRESGALKSVPISDLRKGDRVMTEGGRLVRVECLVRTVADRNEGPLKLVRIGELLVTPYHPVKGVEDSWVFPIDAKGAEVVEIPDCDSVYNLVLEKGERSCAVLMGGVPCVTLGHGIVGDGVVSHAFFGTEAVLDSLKSYDPRGWEMGQVVLKESEVRRDLTTGLISGISAVLPSDAPVSCLGATIVS